MKGIEISRGFWEELFRPAVEEQCPLLMERIAVGLSGSGSDCLGFDDEVSRDHDWWAGCMVWLPERETDSYGFRLSTVYDRLPRKYRGVPAEHRSRQGDGRYGIRSIEAFFRPLAGTPCPPESWRQWLMIPSFALAAATSGEVFYDGPGEFTRIRTALLSGMPEDVRKKKIAARAALMAQSGQYNYKRCLAHGEEGAALLAAGEFVRKSLGMIFLLNRVHMPFYKWAFRAMEQLPVLGEQKEKLETILRSPTEESIESVASAVIAELRAQGLTDGNWNYLEPHAYRVMDRIENREIASLHVRGG